MKLRAVRWTALALLAWLSITALLMALEDGFIYFPTPGGRVQASGEDVWLTAGDGVRLHAFHIEPEGARSTLVYLHGNAGNLADRSEVLEYFAGLGVAVLGLDYRGYGQSAGKPSEAGLYADAIAAYDWLAARVPDRRIVVVGESLGGGPACELALQRRVAGLVLLSTFTSIRDMAARVLPLLPVRWLVRTRFDNLDKIRRIAAPKLIVHSRRDEVIPFAMGQQLAREARPPARHVWLDESTHNDSYFVEGERLGAALRSFVRGLESAP